MTTMCERLEMWDEMDREERFDFLEDLIEEYLTSQGYDEVDVEIGDVADPDADASYDRDTDTITLDGNSLEDDSFSAFDGISTAVHEALHAMDDQDFDGNYDYFGDQGESPVHNQLDLAAKNWAEELLVECQDHGQSVESASAEPLPIVSEVLS